MGKPKVMIIDDSELVLDVVGATLREAGYDVIARSIPIGAGAHIVRERPDLVLLDVSMPLMTGAEISESVRQRSLARSTCIVLHSDRPSDELAELARTCGADGYVQKGGDPLRLLADVQRWIDRARAGEARTSAATHAPYVFVACAPATRALLEDQLSAAVPIRYSDSAAEALRHVCSTRPPSALVVGTSRVDVTLGALHRAACRNNPSWERRIVRIDEPGSPPIEGASLAELPRWSRTQPVAELSMLLGRLVAATG